VTKVEIGFNFLLRLVTMLLVVYGTVDIFTIINRWLFFDANELSMQQYRAMNILDIIKPFVIAIVVYKMGVWTIETFSKTKGINKKEEAKIFDINKFTQSEDRL
jgi:hypothetical protein